MLSLEPISALMPDRCCGRVRLARMGAYTLAGVACRCGS
jgi:hypothetical protein